MDEASREILEDIRRIVDRRDQDAETRLESIRHLLASSQVGLAISKKKKKEKDRSDNMTVFDAGRVDYYRQKRQVVTEQFYRKLKTTLVQSREYEKKMLRMKHELSMLEADPMIVHLGHGGVRRRASKLRQRYARLQRDAQALHDTLTFLQTRDEIFQTYVDAAATGDLETLKHVLAKHSPASDEMIRLLGQSSVLPSRVFHNNEGNGGDDGLLLNFVDDSGQTALHYACRQGHEHIVKYLFQQYLGNHEQPIVLDLLAGDPKLRPFAVACAQGHVGIVHQFCLIHSTTNSSRSHSTLDNIQTLLNEKDEQGRTPLLISCAAGQVDVLEYLLSRHYSRLNLDVVDHVGSNAIHHAIDANSPECLELLLTRTNINVKHKNDEALDGVEYALAQQKIDLAQRIRQSLS